MEFSGKRALVTGAGKGIGRRTVIRLIEEGAEVVAISRGEGDLEALNAECGCRTIQVNLADEQLTRLKIQKAGPFDYLVNCAGIVHLQPFLDITPEAFDETIAVNVRAALVLAQEMARELIQLNRKGPIVNVSSTAAFLAQQNHTIYGASKAALDALTRGMALELGRHGIRANSVNPTVTLTDMAAKAWSDPVRSEALLKRIPLGCFAKPDEVVDVIIYLLSDRAAMINGETVRVDGGHLIT